MLATCLPTGLEEVQLFAVHRWCSTPAKKDLTLDLKLLLSLLVVTFISQLLIKEKDYNVQPSENQLHRHHICLVLICVQEETEVSCDFAMSFYLITNASWSLFSRMQRGYFYMHRLATVIRINSCYFEVGMPQGKFFAKSHTSWLYMTKMTTMTKNYIQTLKYLSAIKIMNCLHHR